MKLNRPSHCDDLLLVLALLITATYSAALLVTAEPRRVPIAMQKPATSTVQTSNAASPQRTLEWASIQDFEASLPAWALSKSTFTRP